MDIANFAFLLGRAGMSQLGGSGSRCSTLCQGHLAGGRASVPSLRGSVVRLSLRSLRAKSLRKASEASLGRKPGES